jgi:beta-xylosidase
VRKLFLTLLASAGLAGSALAAPEQPFVPVFETNFPDPFILPQAGEFLAYATNPEGAAVNVPMARSANLVDWQLVRQGQKLHDAMPDLPPWARKGWTWAPEVIRHGTGYLLYFTAKEQRTGLQCVGVAAAKDPRGPFTSDAKEPLVCQRATGGTIDPHAFRDRDGQLYLYYKNDGNNPDFKKPTDIFVQRLSADGLRLSGEPVALLRNDKDWEAHVIESPTMVRRENGYVRGRWGRAPTARKIRSCTAITIARRAASAGRGTRPCSRRRGGSSWSSTPMPRAGAAAMRARAATCTLPHCCGRRGSRK